ncbi:MAG: malate/lactate/ureidoglycolate dehydrogenase [Acidimicrobiia bacterium]|nr:malate/lactate/ureidoglycolate dehydrogenase [Acidimicrobiia bacterium]
MTTTGPSSERAAPSPSPARPPDTVVPADGLRALVAAITAAAGSSSDEAGTVAANLVEANLQGHDSHGVGMVPRYVAAVHGGGLLPNQHATVAQDAGALLSVDGVRGYGQVVAGEAMALAIERAQAHGSCVLGLGNAHHIGRIGAWAEQATDAGLVSVHFVNVLARSIVAPWGGRDARLGTNPFCVGVPRPGRDPVILDFATSRVAQGKVRVAHNKGQALAPGVMIDAAGEPTTDPATGVKPPFGSLLPFGEHKGYGLALVCELLGGALAAGLPYHGEALRGPEVYNGMLAILVDPARLGHGASFAEQVETVLSWVTGSPPAADVDQVLVAGQPERATKAARLAQGVPVDGGTWRELMATAASVGLDEDAVRQAAGLAAR